MARVKDNPLTRGFSGTIAKLITFTQRAGETVVGKYRRPSSKAPTDTALAIRARFKSSIAYARAAVKNAATKAMYNAAAPAGSSGFNIALADAFKPPVVESIDSGLYHGVVGDVIMVRATDDFKVAALKVSIHNGAGDLLEEGDAVIQEDTIAWLYNAKAANAAVAGSKISAVATDLPGNATTLEVTLP